MPVHSSDLGNLLQKGEVEGTSPFYTIQPLFSCYVMDKSCEQCCLSTFSWRVFKAWQSLIPIENSLISSRLSSVLNINVALGIWFFYFPVYRLVSSLKSYILIHQKFTICCSWVLLPRKPGLASGPVTGTWTTQPSTLPTAERYLNVVSGPLVCRLCC